MEIGNKIKELRTELGITQEELSKALNVSSQAVSKWENGGLPDIELIPGLAKYFNVTTDYLFGLPVNDFKDIEIKVVNYIKSLSHDENKFEKMFKLGFFMESLADVNKVNWEELLDKESFNSQYYSEKGIALASLKRSKPFFAVFPRPVENGFNAILNTKEKQIGFAKELGNKDFYDALVLINTRVSTSFTESLLVKELNISLERSVEIINIFKKIGIIQTTTLELDDKKIDTYTLYDNPALIGLFTFLDMIVERPQAFYYSTSNSNGQYFVKEKVK